MRSGSGPLPASELTPANAPLDVAARQARDGPMAFDAEHWEPPPAAPPVRRGETAICVLIAVLALGALLLPVSLAAVGDLATYLLARR